MYGLVNKAVQDLALARGGPSAWAAIRTRAELDTPSFVTMEQYDDDVTYRLVTAAGEHFGWPADAVLEAFGEHWITYTAQEGHGPLLAALGSTLPEFLGNLDAMHTRIRLTMPALQPPSFSCEELDEGHLRLHYWSDRPGLAPMVVGMLRGLGVRLGVHVEVARVEALGDRHDHEVFDVRYGPARPVAAARSAVGVVSP